MDHLVSILSTPRTRIISITLIVLLSGVISLVGCALVPSGSTNGETSYRTIRYSDLPTEAKTTLHLIDIRGPFPFPQDGSVFNNFEMLLPKKGSGYYHEYTVITPGSSDRGPRRIVIGANGESYYTDDHYASFRLIVR
ncbi:ribonuclease domain-containing protein [Dehalogenimonas etheniformans]|uniref:ribonuclease domain-containing protein n=1 Tax=Dehalogenimonas etheniformans TaxID=1536648 RepID=UPI00167FA58F|nr:ribonuclease domain-containing protein [Dehalogenimonas etheniformans]QNT75254.1 ribonuclease N [Dehalogenimonas etheniformans]